MPMSIQERGTWLLLVVNLVVAGWYFGTIFTAPAGTDLHSPEIARLVARLIVVAIVVAVSGELLLHRLAKAESGTVASDERDQLIRLKASRNGFVVTCVVLALVLGQVASLETMQRMPGHSAYAAAHAPSTVLGLLFAGPLSPLLIAQLLLLTFTLAGLSVYVSRLFYYRRGY